MCVYLRTKFQVSRIILTSFRQGGTPKKPTFLPRVNTTDYNVFADGKNFYDQPISDEIRKYDIKKVANGQGDDYTTRCLLSCQYFKILIS